jgi:TusA-related sulfurtransferase
MKLARLAIVSIFVVFVGTLPHTVGAMFTKAQDNLNKIVQPCPASITSMKKVAKQVARGKVLAIYQSNHEWKSLFVLWNKESRWDYTADNKHSSAYGIPQMLNLSKDTPMTQQIDLGLKYIQHRYGTPTKALAFHDRHGWY